MKRIISLVGLLCCGLWSAVAQMPVTTLQHSGKTRLFYGNNSFSEACDASVNGDTLYLSPGGFTPPASISKGRVGIGAGYAPDSVTIKRRTTIGGTLNIAVGASHLQVEGLYVANDIIFSENVGDIDSVIIKRIILNKLYFNSSGGRRRLGCEVAECILSEVANLDSLSIFHNNIIQGTFYGVNNLLVENNIYLGLCQVLQNVKNTTFSNNIYLCTCDNISASLSEDCSDNVFYNNLFVKIFIDTTNTNTYKAADSTIFVKYSSNADFFAQDFHLKDPSKYIGTDGTQIGIYGGVHAAKEGAAPFNPQILSKSVAPKIDADGKLKISFKVAAQSE